MINQELHELLDDQPSDAWDSWWSTKICMKFLMIKLALPEIVAWDTWWPTQQIIQHTSIPHSPNSAHHFPQTFSRHIHWTYCGASHSTKSYVLPHLLPGNWVWGNWCRHICLYIWANPSLPHHLPTTQCWVYHPADNNILHKSYSLLLLARINPACNYATYGITTFRLATYG